MRKITLQIVVFIWTILGINAFISANPATKQLLRITQKDNRILSFYLCGDEKLSWGMTTDGYTLLVNSFGEYCYAVTDRNGNLIASNVLACDENQRTDSDKLFLENVNARLSFSDSQIEDALNKFGKPFYDYPTTGNNPLLVILVDFPDRKFTHTQAEFQKIMSEVGYSDNNATGSVKDYYYANSFGKLNLNPTVVGPVTMSHNMAYYGATGASFSDCNPKAMISEACAAVDSIIDFNDFDVNNDSILDAVHIIFAGQGESTSGESDAIWPHRWSIYDMDSVQKYFDNIRLRDYSCSAEKKSSGKIDGIGTICHEFGHVLGLPDYYDADYGKSGGDATALASWSIMASGSYNNNGNTPPIFNTNERMRVKWMQPDTLTLQGNYTLHPLIDSNKAYILTTNDSDDYYLIENRSLDSWDAYLPNKGLLIFHIKNDKKDCVNCDPSFQRCDIVEADNDDSKGSLATDVFTADGVNNYFTSYGEPYCFQWSDKSRIDKPITRIEMDTNGIVHFRYLIPDTNAIVKTLNAAQKITSNSFSVKGVSIYDGIGQNAVKGFIVSENETLENGVFFAGSLTEGDTFITILNDLKYSFKYYYKAVAVCNLTDTVSDDNIYTFMTSSGQPVINTHQPKDVDLSSFTLTTKKMIEGDFPITSYGLICDTTDSKDMTKTIVAYDGAMDSFTVKVDNLEQGTKYYCRAYAVTQIGICFGNLISVTTKFIPIENNTIGENPEPSCPDELNYTINTEDVTGGAGDYVYLWQQSTDNKVWDSAQGVNNMKDYTVSSLKTSTYFRRLVRSHNLTSTSNVIFAQVNGSVGGTIFAKDTVEMNSVDTLTLKDYRGKILGWEKSSIEGWQPMENTEDSAVIHILYDKAESLLIRAAVKNAECPTVYSDSLFVTVIKGVGLDAGKVANELMIMPNPAKNFVRVQSERIIHNYQIINGEGAVVKRGNRINNNSIDIDVQSLADGNYLIQINDRTFGKLIIAR